jgi:hypothetical protein
MATIANVAESVPDSRDLQSFGLLVSLSQEIADGSDVTLLSSA